MSESQEQTAALLRPSASRALVVTENGLVEESTLKWKLWREDHGASWSIVHELSAPDGRVVRRDVWINFKGSGLDPAGSQQGGF